MSDLITLDTASRPPAPVSLTVTPAAQPGEAWPTHLERRRPGRRDDTSPELVALMRKPTAEARLRVMLYDAPNFVLPGPDASRGRINPWHAVRMAGAVAGCSLVWAAAFHAMMLLWG